MILLALFLLRRMCRGSNLRFFRVRPTALKEERASRLQNVKRVKRHSCAKPKAIEKVSAVQESAAEGNTEVWVVRRC